MRAALSLRIVGSILLLCLSLGAHGSVGPVVISPDRAIQTHFQYLEDPSGDATVEDVAGRPENQWEPAPDGSATLGITSSAYWLRLPINNRTAKRLNLIAELAYSQLDHVTFYEYSGNRLQRSFRTGDALPFYPRQVDHPHMLFRFQMAPDQTKTLFVRVETAGSMILPLQVWRESEFFGAASNEQKLHFFYYGSLTVIILINLAVFLTLRERLYLYYAIAISGYLLFFASARGYSFQLLYPDSPWLHARALLISMPLLALFSVLFCRRFLRIPSHSPKLDIAIRAMIAFEIINLVCAITLDYNSAVRLSAVSALFFFSLLFVAGPITWAAGVRAGAFFTLAWTPLTIGVLATAGRALGFFPENFVTEHAMHIGSGLEAFILTLALADRLYREREDKIAAQADALRKEKARNEAQNRLTQAMTHDPVTGLPNRNRFERMVNHRLSEDPEGSYFVGVARITRLDEINRTLGLNRSESLIQRIAQQMTSLASQLPSVQFSRDDLGREERVFQISGDCFGLLIDSSRVDDDYQGLNEALRALAEPVMMENLAIELHPRFGAALYPAHGDNAALLIRNAHVGMEIAPHGKFETGVYAAQYDIYSESRLTLMSDLREALNTDQTELYYQPKICLKSGRVVGLEGLIRWHHEDRGWVYPSDFIPLAEETGVILHLTRWAIERGIRDLALLSQQHPDLTLSVNVSARDLSSPNLKHQINESLQRHGIPASRFTLELTETAAMEDPVTGLSALRHLADNGLVISIDDFGSGYSSLSYLKQMPATEIKLDRSIVMDICSSESSRVIVETAINMAHSLDYTVVAEGVENEDCVELLTSLGCDKLQGFWLCHPLPLDELKRWLADYKRPFHSGRKAAEKRS